jgi:hypothetical protein
MRRTMMGIASLLAASMALPQAWAQGSGQRYTPPQRMRLLEGCMKDEVMNGAYCVKKCQADFRMELSGRTAACIAAKSDARYEPPKPEYETPKTPPKPGAPGS